MPFLMIYLIFAWALLAIGLALYAESWDSGAFYQFNKLLRSLGNHSVLTLQWLVYSLAASMILLILLPLAPFHVHPGAGLFGRQFRAPPARRADWQCAMRTPMLSRSPQSMRLSFAAPRVPRRRSAMKQLDVAIGPVQLARAKIGRTEN